MYDNNAKENKQPYVEKMGLKGGTIYYGLYVELLGTHRDWNAYYKIFMSKENMGLIEKSIEAFFVHLRELLAKNMILGIARMTDQRGDSVCLKSLLSNLRSERDWLSKLDNIYEIVKPIRIYRNKLSSHLDEKVNRYDEQGIIQVEIKSMQESITKITELMNEIHICYMDSQVAFDVFERHSAELIISLVKNSLRLERIEKKFLKGDNIQGKDFWTDEI